MNRFYFDTQIAPSPTELICMRSSPYSFSDAETKCPKTCNLCPSLSNSSQSLITPNTVVSFSCLLMILKVKNHLLILLLFHISVFCFHINVCIIV